MFENKGRILTTQKEARLVIEFLIKALWIAYKDDFVRKLTYALHRMIVLGEPLGKDEFFQLEKIASFINIQFPRLNMKHNYYYRELYDNSYSESERQQARDNWDRKVIERAARTMEVNWPKVSVVLERMHRADVGNEIFKDLVFYMRRESDCLISEPTMNKKVGDTRRSKDKERELIDELLSTMRDKSTYESKKQYFDDLIRAKPGHDGNSIEDQLVEHLREVHA